MYEAYLVTVMRYDSLSLVAGQHACPLGSLSTLCLRPPLCHHVQCARCLTLQHRCVSRCSSSCPCVWSEPWTNWRGCLNSEKSLSHSPLGSARFLKTDCPLLLNAAGSVAPLWVLDLTQPSLSTLLFKAYLKLTAPSSLQTV